MNMDNSNDNNDDRLYRNLVILLRIFKNRPNHLAKYLIDNMALGEDFIKKMIKSEKLSNINPDDKIDYFVDSNIETPYFTDYSQMCEFYNEMVINDLKYIQDPMKVQEDLNNKLIGYLNSEKYEDAAKLRDYMKRNKIIISIIKKDGIFIIK